MDKTTIAFFGDSFVGKYEGWIEELCKLNNYECVHIGKPGADAIYSFEKWDIFNKSGKKADICIYSHTSSERLYHPDSCFGLTNGVVAAMATNKMELPPIYNSRKTINAAHEYYTYLSFERADSYKAIIIPIGIDKLMVENNVAFGKIIHLWSFAQYKGKFRNGNWPADADWSLINTESGTNVLLDLSSASFAEPGFILPDPYDHRPNHFSNSANKFMCDLLKFAIEKTNFASNTKAVLDFRPYLKIDNTWNGYSSALEKIKRDLQ